MDSSALHTFLNKIYSMLAKKKKTRYIVQVGKSYLLINNNYWGNNESVISIRKVMCKFLVVSHYFVLQFSSIYSSLQNTFFFPKLLFFLIRAFLLLLDAIGHHYKSLTSHQSPVTTTFKDKLYAFVLGKGSLILSNLICLHNWILGISACMK